jgi:predicted nuclease of restriction endonuclease-like (RecB) superfamily
MSDKRKISDGRKPISNSKFVIPNSFSDLIRQIHRTHAELTAQAYKAVNVSLTLRNWLIGLHITEYEQQGLDRAQYGTALLKNLSIALKQLSVSNCNERELRRYRQFYQEYPQIRGALTPELTDRIPLPANSGGAPQIPAVSENTAKIDGKTLISRLSFTHISELLRLENPQQRAFYEVEAILGNWSIRELKRQIGSLYFERSGLSHNKQKLSELAQTTAEKLTGLNIRDPYVFEFLGLKPAEVMSESDLEQQLIDRLQTFLLELGHGFCFEAQQKRILIGDEYFFVDLVFYHRILKCHVLVELKIERFSHENLGQLNTYVSWYRANMMVEGDNPPIGILLCTDKNHALAEYALAGMDNQLFISRYQLDLPKKEEMQRFIDEQLQSLDAGHQLE